MGKVLVFAEFNHGHLKRSAQELLTAAKKSGHTVAALAVGAGSADIANELARSIGEFEFLQIFSLQISRDISQPSDIFRRTQSGLTLIKKIFNTDLHNFFSEQRTILCWLWSCGQRKK